MLGAAPGRGSFACGELVCSHAHLYVASQGSFPTVREDRRCDMTRDQHGARCRESLKHRRADWRSLEKRAEWENLPDGVRLRTTFRQEDFACPTRSLARHGFMPGSLRRLRKAGYSGENATTGAAGQGSMQVRGQASKTQKCEEGKPLPGVPTGRMGAISSLA